MVNKSEYSSLNSRIAPTVHKAGSDRPADIVVKGTVVLEEGTRFYYNGSKLVSYSSTTRMNNVSEFREQFNRLIRAFKNAGIIG